jgi:CRP-like cAMP-binding protein
VSQKGKEATIAILGEGEFFGEGCLTGQPLRLSSATAMTDCSVMRIDKRAMVEVLHPLARRVECEAITALGVLEAALPYLAWPGARPIKQIAPLLAGPFGFACAHQFH